MKYVDNFFKWLWPVVKEIAFFSFVIISVLTILGTLFYNIAKPLGLF